MTTTLKRRALGIGSAEAGWFAEQNITPEGDAPLASYSDLESWTAYVAWKLGDEAGLTANPDFILHCMTCNRDGKESYRAAYEWLQSSRPPVLALPENATARDKLIALGAAYHPYMTPNELREWGSDTAAAIKAANECSTPLSVEATRLQYLESYHHITQHLIGIAKLSMTPEQRAGIATYERELDVLWCNRLIDTAPNITDDDLTGMFHIPADVVTECRFAAGTKVRVVASSQLFMGDEGIVKGIHPKSGNVMVILPDPDQSPPGEVIINFEPTQLEVL